MQELHKNEMMGPFNIELKALFIASHAFTWLHAQVKTRNECAARKALLTHYEGTNEKIKLRKQCMHP